MTAASTTAYLRQAVYEALTTDTGRSRKLASAYLFQRGLSPAAERKDRSVRARPKPGVFVHIAKPTVDAGVGDELGSEHLYTLSIEITRDYFVAYDRDPETLDAALDRAATDFMRLRAALCWPGSLDETSDGHATGIAGEGLVAPESMATINVNQIQGGDDRLISVTDAFGCLFLFDPDS